MPRFFACARVGELGNPWEVGFFGYTVRRKLISKFLGMRKILTVIAFLVAAWLVVYSFPTTQHTQSLTDGFLAPSGLVALVEQKGEQQKNLVRIPVEKFPSPTADSVWYLPLSNLDGVYFRGTNTGSVSLSVNEKTTTIHLGSLGAYVFFTNDPFLSYIVKDGDNAFRIKPLQNGAFIIVKEAQLVRIYSVNAILTLSILNKGRPMTSVDIYPGVLMFYDPSTALQLKNGDALLATQKNPFLFVDIYEDGCRAMPTLETGSGGMSEETGLGKFPEGDFCKKKYAKSSDSEGVSYQKTALNFSETVFGEGFDLFFKTVQTDIATQITSYRNLFSQRKKGGFSGVAGLPNPLQPSAVLINRYKEALALQNLLLRRLNEMADAPKDHNKEYLLEILNRIEQVAPESYVSALDLVQNFYVLYWLNSIYHANQAALLATDSFTEATRSLFGCQMTAPYFSGLSNLFLAYFLQSTSPPKDTRITKIDTVTLNLLLRTYISFQIASSKEVPVIKKANTNTVDCKETSTITGITSDNVHSFWLFLVQYLDRVNFETTPSLNTLHLDGMMIKLGRQYLDSIASRDFEFRKTEIKTMERYYRNIFTRQITALQKNLFQSMTPFPVFSEEHIQGGELRIDAAIPVELESLASDIEGLTKYITSSAVLKAADIRQEREIRLVGNSLKQQSSSPIRYLHCLLINERKYRFLDDTAKISFCSQSSGDVPMVNTSSIGAEVRSSVSTITTTTESGGVINPVASGTVVTPRMSRPHPRR